MIQPLPKNRLKKFYQSLPTKRIAAGALFFNHKNEVLVIKPSYKNHWSIPGGVVEREESPRQACQRECREEIGLKPTKLTLLCIDYKNSSNPKPESIQMVYYAGRLSQNTISKIKIDN